ncbi:MAG: outer membrane beta-barrel protein [Nitrospira sp.]|nr:hypothetical protein [Candidatus Manganitrophaceae bacterium]HIL33784.1 hypothetical protein [Candidatus Manganitrophaceae bacterium]
MIFIRLIYLIHDLINPLLRIHQAFIQGLLVLGIVFLSILLNPTGVMGKAFRVIPSLTVEERFDDNIFSVARVRERDSITVIKGLLRFNREGVRLKSQVQYNVRFEIFSRHTELNKGRPFQELSAKGILKLGKGAQLELIESLSFTPVQAEFLGTSHVGNILGEGIRTRREESFRNVADIKFRQPLTMKIIFLSGFKNAISRYDNPALIDHSRNDVTVGIDYEIASWSIPSLKYRYENISYDGIGNANINFVNLGYTHKIWRTGTVDLSLGIAFSEESDGKRLDPLFVGQLDINRSLRDWEWRVRYARKIGISGGFLKALSMSNRVSLNMSRKVRRNLTARLSGNYARNKSIGRVQIDVHSYEGRFGLEYLINPSLMMRLGYSYLRQESDDFVTSNIIRNQTLISVMARY